MRVRVYEETASGDDPIEDVYCDSFTAPRPGENFRTPKLGCWRVVDHVDYEIEGWLELEMHERHEQIVNIFLRRNLV